MAHVIPPDLLKKLHEYRKGKASRAEVEQAALEYRNLLTVHYHTGAFTVEFQHDQHV